MDENINKIEIKQDIEEKPNLNMRVNASLKEKIKTKINDLKTTPDEFITKMFYSYIKEEAENKGDIDYSQDVQELENVIKRIVTIYKNMVEKTYMQNSITKDNFNKQIEDLSLNIKNDYIKKIDKLTIENEKVEKEYNMISEQAKGLLKDTKELRENFALLKEKDEKNEELIKTYKEQIDSLKDTNIHLQEKIKNTVDSSLLEKAKFEKDKELLAKDKYYQDIINNIQVKYNELNLKYITESKEQNHKRKTNNIEI